MQVQYVEGGAHGAMHGGNARLLGAAWVILNCGIQSKHLHETAY